MLHNKEGMAKYLYKNIRRKQKVIDEKFSFIFKKQQQELYQGNWMEFPDFDDKAKNKLKRSGSTRKEEGVPKMFFTPSFVSSVI